MSLPDINQTRIVCAALQFDGGFIVPGPRHFDEIMHPIISKANPGRTTKVVQGFIDQRGNFYDRQQAYKIAMEAGQISRRVGGDEGTLYSENLY